jgi:hypothetical protein
VLRFKKLFKIEELIIPQFKIKALPHMFLEGPATCNLLPSAETVENLNPPVPSPLVYRAPGSGCFSAWTTSLMQKSSASSEEEEIITATKLRDYIADKHNGILSTNHMKTLYLLFPELENIFKTQNLKKFCQKHSSLLRFREPCSDLGVASRCIVVNESKYSLQEEASEVVGENLHDQERITAEALCAWIKTAPGMRIVAGTHPPWDLVSFYLLHPTLQRFKASKLPRRYPHLLSWLQGSKDTKYGEMNYIYAVVSDVKTYISF